MAALSLSHQAGVGQKLPIRINTLVCPRLLLGQYELSPQDSLTPPSELPE